MAGLNNSIFDLASSLEEIRRPEDVIKVYTRKVIPKAGSTGTNFPGSDVTFDFSLAANQYWLPSRSFVVIRDEIYQGVGDNPVKPLLTGKGAPAFNLPDNLWDGYELTVGGFSMGSKTKLAPQIAVCEKRLSKSRGYLKGVAASAKEWIPSFGRRKHEVVLNGSTQPDELDEFKIGDDVTVVAAANTFTGIGTTFLTDLAPGDHVRTAAGNVYLIRFIDSDLVARISSAAGNIAEANVAAYRIGSNASNRANLNERMFQPALGVFKQGKALPPARYELILRPKPDVLYKQSALETNDVTVISGGNRAPSGSDDLPTGQYEYIINEIVFYVAIVENYERPPDKMTYVLDLEETEVLPRQITGGSALTENFTVSKSTFGLSVALQDRRAGQNTRFSPSLFKVEGDFQDQITLLRIDYAGQTRPNPQKSMSHNVGAVASQDFSTWGYGETAVEDLAWYDTGGALVKDDWRRLGNLFHYQWRKTGDDISTDVNVEVSYPNDFATTAPVNADAKHNLLLFHHFRRVIEMTIENNQVVNFLAQDA